jgi:soluble lytic murein transglycosylase-like protein
MLRLTQKVLVTAALMLLAGQVRAAEHVTLRNGFEMSCQHHARVQSRVRLYLNSGLDSYIEVTPTDIASIETVPDPPLPAVSDPVASDGARNNSPTSDSSASDSSARQALLPVKKEQPGSSTMPATELNPADLREMLASAGHAHNLDVDLLASVVKAESGGNAHAVSRTGARGLMQLMPHTAADLGVQDSFRPEQNIRGGSSYLDALLTRYHDNLALALAAYNAGPAAVDKYHGIPPYHETKLYVARVIHEFNRRVLAREADARRAMATAIPKMGGR